MANEVKIGIIITYLSIAIRLSTQFLVTPYIVSSLGSAEYGLFTLSNSIIIWLAVTDFGLGVTISKYIVTYRAHRQVTEQAHFLGQSTLIFTLLGCVAAVVGIFLYFKLHYFFPNLTDNELETLQVLYLLTLFNLILSFPLRPLSYIPHSYQKFITPGIVSLSFSIANALLTIIILYLDFKSVGLTVMAVSLGILNLLWNLLYSLKYLEVKFIFKKPDFILWKEMFHFGFWNFVGMFVDLFYWRAGAPILANLSTTKAVGIYTLGILFAQSFMTASSAISGVLSPKMMHLVATNATKYQLTQTMIQAGRAQLCILTTILAIFALMGKDFLQLWVGSTYGNDVYLIWMGALCILLPLTIPLTQNTALPILQALNLIKGRTLLLIISSTLCVIAGYFLTSFIGTMGMFIGTTISLIIGQGIMMNIYYISKAGLQIGLYFKQTYLPILRPLLLILLIGALINHYININSWPIFICTATLYALCCMVILFVLYLNKNEKNMMLAPIKQLLHIS